MSYANDIRLIFENHYEWCKKEGRDISWYKEYKEGKKMFVWKHPKYYKELKKNNLTKENFSDKGEDYEKIQNKINRTGDRSSSDNPNRGRTNNRKNRK